MQSGREQLAAWLERSRLTQREFARQIGLYEPNLSKILNGITRPGLPIAVRIEDRTGIPVRSWVPMPVGKSKPAKKTRRHIPENAEVSGVLSGASRS